MYIAARMAMQSPRNDTPANGPSPAVTPPSPAACFHGRDVMIRVLSENGFEADSRDEYPVGALVRVRLPGAGAALARITSMADGRVEGSFLNPVRPSRLAMAIGTR